MTVLAVHRNPNIVFLAGLWSLTIFALIPFPNLGLMLVGAAANLAANGMALYLLCSRSRVDRANGFARLAFQGIILLVCVAALARSGVSLDGFFRYITQQLR